jgi:hypothetical protein
MLRNLLVACMLALLALPVQAAQPGPVGKVAVTCLGDVVAVGASAVPVRWLLVTRMTGRAALQLETAQGSLFAREVVSALRGQPLRDVRAELYADGALVAQDAMDCALPLPG